MAERSPQFDVKIRQHCEAHKESYQTYCRSHEAPCCRKCEREYHKKCKNIVQLDAAVLDTNMPSYLSEVQMQLDNLVANLKTIQEDRQQNSTNMTKQRQRIEDEISVIRKNINDHLDKLQTSIVNKLSEIEADTMKTTHELLNSLQENEREVTEIQQNTVAIKKNGSDRQVFLYLKQTEAAVVQNENYLQLLKEQGDLDQDQLSFRVNDSLRDFQTKLQNFGEISVETVPGTVNIEQGKANQAQRHIPMPTKGIDNISLEVNRKINHGFKYIYGCFILSDETTLFSIFDQNKFVAVNKEGSIDFEINVELPRGITSIDENTIAVATLDSISIIGLKDRSVMRTIKFNSLIYGLTYKDGKLICCVRDKGIISVSLEDESVTSIVDCNLPAFSYVTTYGDNIYYTGGLFSNTVTCCDFEGNLQWQFEEDSILSGTKGVGVDGNGHIFVAGINTTNIVLISSGGINHKIILNKDNGLTNPMALNYDKTTKKLLVSNCDDTAVLFNIK